MKFICNVHGLKIYTQGARVVIESEDGARVALVASSVASGINATFSMGGLSPQTVDVRYENDNPIGFRIIPS